MKTLSLFTTILFVLFSSVSFGQSKSSNSENIKVWGNCGMCKKTIETAAKSAGASKASWNDETQILAVSYKGKKTSSDKIQQAIAAAGYDTEKFSADDKVYDNLHGCCKYDRKETSSVTPAKQSCCTDAACTNCNHDDCGKDKQVCKEKGCCKS